MGAFEKVSLVKWFEAQSVLKTVLAAPLFLYCIFVLRKLRTCLNVST